MFGRVGESAADVVELTGNAEQAISNGRYK